MKKNVKHIIQKISFALSLLLIIFLLSNEILSLRSHSEDMEQSKITFVLDVSKSMNVEDIDGETRLSTAKQMIQNIMSLYPESSYSLNIFAGDFQRILPYTNDNELFLTLLFSLDYRNITKQGSDIPMALSRITDIVAGGEEGIIVFITDGSEDEIKISQEIKELYSDIAIQTFILGVGTQEGGYIPTGNVVRPFEIYEGERVVARLNEVGLQNIAKQLDAKYIDNFKQIDILDFRKSEGFTKVLLYLMSIVCLLHIGIVLHNWYLNKVKSYE